VVIVSSATVDIRFVRLRLGILTVFIAVAAAFLATPVWGGVHGDGGTPERPVATAPAPTQGSSAPPESSSPEPPSSTPTTPTADPCESSWCMRRVEGDEVGALYLREDGWRTEFILGRGESVCARPAEVPSGLEQIMRGAEPVWEAYAPDNTALHDTYFFQSEVSTGQPCEGPPTASGPANDNPTNTDQGGS
jgi:hypothetical protein